MKQNLTAVPEPSTQQDTSVPLLELVFSKLKELNANGKPAELFPQGLSSVEVAWSVSQDKQEFRLALKAAEAANETTTLVQSEEADDDVQATFNATGHNVIALIAKADLEEKAPGIKAKVDAILNGVNRDWEAAAVFPDQIRNTRPETKPFHFIDIPFKDGGPANPPLPPAPHVLSKLAEYTDFFKQGSGDKTEKGDAVSWLFHLVGDVHLPLHCIQRFSDLHPAGDRGGNSFQLKGKAKNLHAAWDSSVNVSGQIDDADLAAKIMQLHTRASLQKDLAEANTEKWARASFKLAKEQAYTLQENPKNPPKLSTAYIKNMEKIGRRQAALAGYRLSDRLQEIFK